MPRAPAPSPRRPPRPGRRLYWYANDGRGTFERHVVTANDAGSFERHARCAPRWGRHVLLDVWHNGNSVLLHDLNGDGRLDVLSTAERGTNELRWWRNDGP